MREANNERTRALDPDNSGIFRYTYVRPNSSLAPFETEGNGTPTINGEPVDYAPDYTFKGPFLNEAWASGIVTIGKGDRKLTLDFNKIERR